MQAQTKKFFKTLLIFLAGCMLMVLVYTQSPLYSSNQHQYFLHGMAQAGLGSLDEDWLARTAEPTPLFSLLVAGVLRYLRLPFFFYVIYALIMGFYLFCLLGILDKVFNLRSSRLRFLFTLTLVLLIHSALLRFIISSLFGAQWMFLFDGGVAGQRLLGTVLQPSAFGVLLLFSVYLFISEKPVWASLAAALAACIHPTYLLSAALLVAGYLLQTVFIEKKTHKFVPMSIIALAAVTPILVYIFSNFWSVEGAEKAHAILTEIRIPHHAVVSVWFDMTSLIKMAVVIMGLYIIRNHKKLFIPLMLVFCISVLLSLYQVHSGDLFLALIFPWRPSALLVPIFSSVLIAHFSCWLSSRMEKSRLPGLRTITILCIVIMALLSLAGILRMKTTSDVVQTAGYYQMQSWVRDNSQDGDRFLIPVDLEGFRTFTLRPIYVDFFAIPYSNKDVINWYHRVLAANKFYDTGDCNELFHIYHDASINHLVTRVNNIQPTCEGLQKVYEDQEFLIYKIKRLRNPGISMQLNMVI